MGAKDGEAVNDIRTAVSRVIWRPVRSKLKRRIGIFLGVEPILLVRVLRYLGCSGWFLEAFPGRNRSMDLMQLAPSAGKIWYFLTTVFLREFGTLNA